MARLRTVVTTERLRDQVYRLIRDELTSGALAPGQRIIEGELAARYKVSRTPVREALFLLARDGLLSAAPDRGYIVVIDTMTAMMHRHDVRELIDPQLARRAALEGSPMQKRAFAQAQERQRAAHANGDAPGFVEANTAFRDRLRAMCANALLAQCSALLDDQGQWGRRAAFARADYRAIELACNDRLLSAVARGDGEGAAEAMLAYIAIIRVNSLASA